MCRMSLFVYVNALFSLPWIVRGLFGPVSNGPSACYASNFVQEEPWAQHSQSSSVPNAQSLNASTVGAMMATREVSDQIRYMYISCVLFVFCFMCAVLSSTDLFGVYTYTYIYCICTYMHIQIITKT